MTAPRNPEENEMTTTLRRSLAAMTLVGVALAGVAGPAAAGKTKPTRPDALTIVGSGSWTGDSTGGTATAPVDVWLPQSSEPEPAMATATLAAADGSFPAPEQCEPADAVISIDGDRKLDLTLVATGNVCGAFAEIPTAPTTQRFTGRYLVVDGPNRFTGDDGFAQIILYEPEGAYVFAVDT